MRAQKKKKREESARVVEFSPPGTLAEGRREVFGVLLLVLSAVLFLSLLLNPEAVRGIATSDGAGGAGILGHHIARFFGTLFGLSAFLVPLLTGVWGVHLFFCGKVRNVLAVSVGLVLGILTLSALLGRLFGDLYLGGAVGDRLAADLDRYFGVVSYVVLAFLGATAAVVATPLTYRSIFEAVATGLGAIVVAITAGWGRFEEIATARAGGGALRRIKKPVPGAAETQGDEGEEDEELEDSSQRRAAFEKAKARVVQLAPRRARRKGPSEDPPAPAGPAEEPETPRREVAETAASNAPVLAAEDFEIPPTDLLDEPPEDEAVSEEDLKRKADLLAETLAEFGVECKVGDIVPGPVVTRFELIPAPGVKVSQITTRQDDIALAMAAPQIRIEAPIPGKAAVGIEVPNRRKNIVHLRDVLESDAFRSMRQTSPLTLALGKDISGVPVVADLRRMPHLLIAGATGAGKSVLINSIIHSIIYSAKPDEVKMLMIDPKVVELQEYNGLPHLLAPVVTDVRLAPDVLEWAVEEMERRYRYLAKGGVRDIESYNAGAGLRARMRVEAEGGDENPLPPERLPYIVLVVDEFADLMLLSAKECEEAIIRIAQMARAVGIHLVIATQRPSVDVITGVIKANLPSRIAFQVTSRVDSRTILDLSGAERLLGRGDMLFKPGDRPKPIRVQGCFVSGEEIARSVAFYRKQGRVPYTLAIASRTMPAEPENPLAAVEDELLPQAVRIAAEDGMASVSRLQRRLQIGHPRASRLVDIMEARGLVGPPDGSKPRELRFDPNELEEVIKRLQET